VSTQSDRMGYRLTGVPLRLAEPLELLSEGVTTGTIQLPPGGDPIVLLADRQTIGGYPRIGHVASVDLPALAQRRPGEFVRFLAWTVAGARAAAQEREAELTHLAGAVGALSREP
jgi:antagonist of KipI